ncbi:FlgB family protein [Tropicimonas marinistellae]|uniref:FlgB family protein n=1 Tax=Tropicimonas marinistellae TaxID=1739787 RepID=UPI0008336992|nr:FlgB family protein [Tropicimonas marinistellae]
MFSNLDLLQLARGLAEHAVSRHSVVARNIANADTPGYRQRDIEPFAAFVQQEAGMEQLRQTRAGHIDSDRAVVQPTTFEVANVIAEPNGNNVTLETEIVKAAEVRQQHELALSIYRSGLNVLRSSLGRR